MSIEILKVGVWLYDGTAKKPVDIVGLPYDWWFSMAEADDMLEPGEEPMPLNEKGFLYYVRFREPLINRTNTVLLMKFSKI